jgi:hypothetical protein
MSKPFSKFTQVVEGLQSSVLWPEVEAESLLPTIIHYCKFHYEDNETVEENIDRITQVIEEDL